MLIAVLAGLAWLIYFFWLSENDPEKADEELEEFNQLRTLRRIRDLEAYKRELEDDYDNLRQRVRELEWRENNR